MSSLFLVPYNSRHIAHKHYNCKFIIIVIVFSEPTVQAENKVVVLDGVQLYTSASLACFIQPEGSSTRWITPDETNVLSFQSDGQYFVSEGVVGVPSGENRYGSVLVIQDVSYKNAGIYVCEAMDEENCSDFPKFATVELILKSKCEQLGSKHNNNIPIL